MEMLDRKKFSWFANDRKAPWDGLGHDITKASTSREALAYAGLDWEVAQTPALIELDGQTVPTGDVVNYRVSDKKVLGTVSNRYRIIQNAEAFSFTDNLIGGDVTYEAAGFLEGGRVVWMMARLPEMNVLGDQIGSYLLFSNSHDGTSGVKCCVTNIRIVCENMLNSIVKNAIRTWSFSHLGDIETKVAAARKTLEVAALYNEEFTAHAERLAKKKITRAQARAILDELFPLEDEMGKIKVAHLAQLREIFIHCYEADDIANFKGTGWGMLNAFSDMIYHGGTTFRITEGYAEKGMMSAINGNKLFNKAQALILAA